MGADEFVGATLPLGLVCQKYECSVPIFDIVRIEPSIEASWS